MRAAALLVLGLLFGFAGALIQTFTITVGSVQLPAGALLTLVAVVLVARAGAWWQGSRLGAITFSIGWLTASLMMGSKTGAGDLILSSGTRQMGYLIGGTILLATACGYPLLPADDTPDRPVASQAGAGAEATDA
jgi:Family of unknown function (DUF6113)